ncbi:TonB-dependent receptor [Pelagicoccus mobilis]|uniref:TonB-dependent receptor n=1 Tax=Pelagicoccus mobilis TaxID=415221 RepID=A0A934VQL2_9BACT|nr:TonB-dependent receptor [Pelagicoccus mobilis]MBK1876698.1 TonB-dependent receptor [Pelagicoccus mobilis]
MNKYTKTRASRVTASALLLLGLATSPFAHSQDDDEAIFELDAFKVTGGYAGSLAAATEAKRLAPVIVEAISAEDIGKLPDTSIAESIARLPGITTQRVNSRAQRIVIRGLGGDFSTALLNGRQQVSTSGDRSVEFDQYPAELLNGVVVYKTTNPSLLGQGLAGTVDMRTVSPLKHGKKTVAANVFYEWADMGNLNPESDDSGLRYSLNYIDQLNEGKVGIAFGYVKTDKPGQGEQWNAWGYPTTGDGDYVLGGAKPFVRSSNLERESFLGVAEFQPNENVHSMIDIFYSEFTENQYLRGIEMPLQWSSAQLQDGYTVEDGLVTEGTFDNFYGVMRNDIVWRDADLFSAGWNIRVGDNGGDGWIFEADLAMSEVDRKDNVLETYSGYASNQSGTPDSVHYSLEGGTGAIFTPTLDYADHDAVKLTSPQGWASGTVPGGQVGFFKGPKADDKLEQVRVSLEKELPSVFNRFEGGLAYTSRDKSEIEAGPGGTEGFFLALPNGATSADLPPSIGTTSLAFIGIPGMVSYDARALYESGYYDEIANDNPAYVANNYAIGEDVYTAYAQFDIQSRIADIPVTGTIGAQYVQTDQSSRGLATNGQTTFEKTGEHDYDDFVPSLNLNFAVGQSSNVRFSAARQLARQEMVDMRAGSNYGFDERLADSTDPQQSPWSGSGGNPALEPWRSNSLDLTYEKYFEKGMGFWAINGFYKDLRSYTYDQPILSDFTGFETGSDLTPAIYEGYLTVPQNGSGGSIKGIEGTISVPGEFMSDSLKGFGLILSGAYVDSSIQPDLGNPSQPIPGLSDTVINGTIYYENENGFQARLSSRYRSEFRGDIATFGPRGEVFRSLQSETVVDAQVSYNFKSGALEGASITLQGYNLTDEPLFATQGDSDPRLVQDYQLYGAQYSVGFSYKY